MKLFVIISPVIINFFFSVTGHSQNNKEDKIYYISLNQAIQEGQWIGIRTVKEMKQHGDFGLGSEEMLASELVLSDGKAFGIPWNGKAELLKETSKIAYAAVKFFKADTAISIKKTMLVSELQEKLALLIDKNAFAAIRIKTKFLQVQYRSFKKSERPFTNTDQALADTLNKTNISGEIIGFYTPESAKMINSPVYHFHMIDVARSTGGHLLNAKLEYADIEIDFAKGIEIALPDPGLLKQVNLTK